MSVRKSIAQSGTAAHTPRAVNTACRAGCQVFANVQLTQFGKPPLATLPTSPVYTTQATPYPTVKHLQYRAALAVAKIAPPANQVTIQFLNHLLDCHTTSITSQFPDSLLEAAQTARSNAPFALLTGYYAKAQKLTPPGSVGLALGLINLKLELSSDELADACHYSLACSFAADINVAIVGITYEPMASTLQISVKLIKNYV